MKCSIGISSFLEEISSLSHSVGFLYFFSLITEEGFLISSCYSLELCIPITSWEIDGETVETVADFIFLGSKVTVDGDCSHKLKDAYSLEEKL